MADKEKLDEFLEQFWILWEELSKNKDIRMRMLAAPVGDAIREDGNGEVKVMQAVFTWSFRARCSIAGWSRGTWTSRSTHYL